MQHDATKWKRKCAPAPPCWVCGPPRIWTPWRAPDARTWVERFDTTFNENQQTLEGSFSSVSRPIFATKYSFFSIFRYLQDLQSFAPLQIQKFSKIRQFFSYFLFKFAEKIHYLKYFSTIFIEFCTDSDEFFSEFRRLVFKMLRVPPNFRISKKFCEHFLNADRISTEFWCAKIRMVRSLGNRIFQLCPMLIRILRNPNRRALTSRIT